MTASTATRATTTVPPAARVDTTPTARDLAAATRRTGAAVAAVTAHDPRWDRLGPLVTALADELRRALGTTVSHAATAVPPVVRQRDLAVAARRLLGSPPLTDTTAARTVLRLADEIVALS